jgi:hypothetical protein
VQILMPSVDTAVLSMMLSSTTSTNSTNTTSVVSEAETNAKNECTSSKKPSVASRSFKCAQRRCEVLVKKERLIGDCFSLRGTDCGQKHRVVEEKCYSETMKEFVTLRSDFAGSQCDQISGSRAVYTSLRACENPTSCGTEPFYQYAPWSKCTTPESCSSCPATERSCAYDGTKDRVAKCVKETDGSLAEAPGECTSAEAETRDYCTKICYNVIQKFTRTEDVCVASGCGTEGVRTVTYTPCTGGVGCMSRTGITGTAIVTESEPCAGEPCDACEAEYCISVNTESKATVNGECACTCKGGFTGKRCHLQEGIVLTVLDDSGMECGTGVVDLSGKCCSTGEVDGCGYCAGVAVDGMGAYRIGFDQDGACCHGTTEDVFLTGDFTCCGGPEMLDECGVCNGEGDSCSKVIDGEIALTLTSSVADFTSAMIAALPPDVAGDLEAPTASRRRLSQTTTQVQYTLPQGHATTVGQLAGVFTTVGAQAAITGILASAPAVPNPSVVGQANNGICETGEPLASNDCIVPLDCPLPSALDDGVYLGNPTLSCSGNGVCMRATGTCSCSKGYAGEGCDECDEGNNYVAVPVASGWACSRLASDFPAPQTIPPPNTSPAPTPGTTDSESSGLGLGPIIGIVVGSVGGVAVIAGVAYYFLRIRGAKEVSPV